MQCRPGGVIVPHRQQGQGSALAMEETADSLVAKFRENTARLAKCGLSEELLFGNSLVTPGCGLGALPAEVAERAIRLTRDVSEILRKGK